MPTTTGAHRRSSRRGTEVAAAAVVGSLLAIFLVAGYFFAQSIALESERSLVEADAIARSVAALIDAREDGYKKVLVAFATRARLRDAIVTRDRAEALANLRQILETFPDMDRPFLADPAGTLWVTYPEAPEAQGRSFADRDWYRGVSRDWRPYVSEVFVGGVSREPVVSLVVPVHDREGRVVGILGSAQRLRIIRSWLLPIEVPGGELFVVDRAGRLVFHRTRVGPDRLLDYAGIPVVQRLIRGEEGVAEIENPVDGHVRLAAYRRIGALGWGLVVDRQKGVALDRTRTLILVSGLAGLSLTLVLIALGLQAIRARRRTLAARAERERALEELRRANAFLDSLVENVPHMIFVKDAADLRFVRFNRAGEALLGHPREALIGKNDHDFFPPAEADFFTAKDREVLRGGQLVDIPEEPVQTLHQGTRILHTKKIPMVDAGGQPLYLLGISEDITERKQGEAALRAATQEAERANRAKSEFLSRMSHELRTPLNAILGFAQLLEMDPLPAEQAESVGQILRAGRHLLGLINEVLDISRIEAGRLQLSLEPVPVAETLRGAMDLVRPMAADRGLELRADLPPDEAHVVADRQRLQQVLLNLLSNAVKYNRPGGWVAMSTAPGTERRLRISVADSGPGIPSEKLALLFVPFERLGAEESGIEGTGLGLVLSKHLVEAMGGVISVESELYAGTAFSIELPVAEAPVLALPHPWAPARRPANPDAPALSVLYVEDNLSNLRLIERLLGRRPGTRLLSAMQGRLGLDLAREHRPDLILLDRHLPDVSGDEVLRQLRADPETRDIPVVILSADATPGQIARLRAAGAHGYLTKPLDVQNLLALLDETLPRGPARE